MGEPSGKYQVASAVNTEIYHELDLASRGAIDEKSNVNLMKEAYEAKNFKVVTESFELIEDKSALNNELNFIAAIAYARQKKNQQAISLFSSILESEESAYSFHQETRWYLSLTYIDAREIEKAILTLNDIQPTHDFFDNAQLLLAQLK